MTPSFHFRPAWRGAFEALRKSPSGAGSAISADGKQEGGRKESRKSRVCCACGDKKKKATPAQCADAALPRNAPSPGAAPGATVDSALPSAAKYPAPGALPATLHRQPKSRAHLSLSSTVHREFHKNLCVLFERNRKFFTNQTSFCTLITPSSF